MPPPTAPPDSPKFLTNWPARTARPAHHGPGVTCTYDWTQLTPSASGAPAIETFGLTKTYGSTTAVAGLSLRGEPEQIFGFLGPNGAGKSTTIRMLLALQRPTAGRAALLGLDAASDSVEVHRRVSYLPGDLELFPRLTGRQHIAWFARARGVETGPLARQLSDRFQVVADHPVRELSKGNRQKIGLVLAFMHRPELLILDESTSGLDPLMQRASRGAAAA